MDGVHKGGEFAEGFAAEVHAVEISLSGHVLVDFGDGDLADDVQGGGIQKRRGFLRWGPGGETHVCG